MKVIVTSSPTLLYSVKVDLNLGYMQATHTRSHVTLGPFVSSDHQLHLHHREQEDTHSMSTHCRPGLSTSDGRYGRFDRFLNICARTYTSLFYPPFFSMLCKHVDSQKNTMSLHYLQSESLTS